MIVIIFTRIMIKEVKNDGIIIVIHLPLPIIKCLYRKKVFTTTMRFHDRPMDITKNIYEGFILFKFFLIATSILLFSNCIKPSQFEIY